MTDRILMKRVRLIGVAAALLVAPAAMAQTGQPDDHVRRIVARSEVKHLRSRQNLLKILSTQPQFWPELLAVAERLKTQPAWLLNIMATESLFDPSSRNALPGQSASGLLQWIESTARSMGTTTAAIRRMDPVNQLGLVEKYLAPLGGRLNSLADVYMAVLRGFIVDGKDETVVSPLNNSRKEQRIYKLNKWLDLDDDRKITKGELALAATLIGRFQPQDSASPHHSRYLRPTLFAPSAFPNRKPVTRSIYIRSPKPVE
jgi:Transglycosylase SLT domain